jgi:hypothetical protein
MESAIGIVVGGLALLDFVAWIWLVVRAFRGGGFAWGLAMLAIPAVLAVIGGMLMASPAAAGLAVLSVPILGFVHVRRHDGDGKLAFMLTLPGTVAIVIVTVLSVMGVAGFGGQPPG